MNKLKYQSLRVEQPMQEGSEESGLRLSYGKQKEVGRSYGVMYNQQYKQFSAPFLAYSSER